MNLKLAVVKQAKDIIFSVRWVFFCSQLVAVLETLSFITAEPQKLSFSKGQLEIFKRAKLIPCKWLLYRTMLEMAFWYSLSLNVAMFKVL